MSLVRPNGCEKSDNLKQGTNQRHVQFFFIKDFETSLDVMPEFLSINWDVVLVHPVRVKDWSQECIITVDVGEMTYSYFIDIFVRPDETKPLC